MDKLPDHIGFTNPHLPLIPYDNYSSTIISVSVSGGDMSLNYGVESSQPPEPPPPAPKIAPYGSGQCQWVSYHGGGWLIRLNNSGTHQSCTQS